MTKKVLLGCLSISIKTSQDALLSDSHNSPSYHTLLSSSSFQNQYLTSLFTQPTKTICRALLSVSCLSRTSMSSEYYKNKDYFSADDFSFPLELLLRLIDQPLFSPNFQLWVFLCQEHWSVSRWETYPLFTLLMIQIVTCVDPRISPEKFLDLGPGQFVYLFRYTKLCNDSV